MKNKGFTLVELLAVIAILAILVIMALPAVLRMYRQSRINNFQNEVRTVYRTAQSQFLADSMLLESGQTIAYTNAGTSVTGVNVVKELDMTGNTNFKYYVLINVDGKVLNVRASNGTYSFSKQASDAAHDLKIDDIDVETNNDSTLDSDITTTVCPATEATYGSSSSATNIITVVSGQTCNKTDVGCELTIAGENFYVISSDSTNTMLLAKYDLDTTLNSQTSTNPTLITFSNGNYWDDGNKNLLSPYNDNGANYKGNPYPYVYDSNSDLYTYVNAYANKMAIATGISISGKIMSYEQAMSLSTDMRKDLNNHYYWLGSAVLLGGYCSQQIDYKYDESDTPKVQFLYGPGGAPQPEEPSPYPTPGNTSCGYVTIWTISYSGSINQVDSGFGNGNSYIRPVIIVSTSAL